MRIVSMVLLCLIPLTGTFGEEFRGDPKAQIITNLNRIESAYLAMLSGKELQDAVRLLNETRGLVAGISVGPSRGSPDASNLISDEGLQSLADAVQKEHFDDDRTELIVGAVGKKGRITMGQVKTLLRYYSRGGSDMSKLLIDLHDNVVDPVNISVVLGLFVYPSDRDAVLKAYQDR